MQNAILCGALFDFLGFLTSRENPIVFSAFHDATFAVEALREWCELRGININDADVDGWKESLVSEHRVLSQNVEITTADKPIGGAIAKVLQANVPLDRNRPYNGQRHTCLGERGKTLVEGLTMRDVRDCLIRAFAVCSGLHDKYEDGSLTPGDLYTVDVDVDPIAVAQNLGCEIEMMMGIFPNIKPCQSDTVEGMLAECGAEIIEMEEK